MSLDSHQMLGVAKTSVCDSKHASESGAQCTIVPVERNMELIRDILLKVEADDELDGYSWREFGNQDFPDYSVRVIAYHVTELIEAGFLLGNEDMGTDAPMVSRLTWNGHEFLDNIKNDGIWAKVKAQTATLGNVAVGVVAKVAETVVLQHLGLSK